MVRIIKSYLLAVLVQLGELPQKVDQGTLAERMLDGGVEGDGGVLGTQNGDPFLGDPRWDKIDFVQHQDLRRSQRFFKGL